MTPIVAAASEEEGAPFDPSRPAPRVTCERCKRPPQLCWCAHLVSLETRTRIVLLQHPAERRVAIGTARMASLCLPSSELHVGVQWSASSALAGVLSDPARPAALLYPGEGAIDIATDPPRGPITLVVVDGTWHQARKLVRVNPMLARLPRYAFRPHAPSEYRIRREPDESYVSTLEALAHVLGVLEGDPERFRALLVPFRAMIDAQLACEKREQNHRGRKPRPPRPPRPGPRDVLRERAADLLCIAAEANAWARRASPRDHRFPDELLHWIAHRPATGETFESIVRPRHPLGPGTAVQSELDPRAIDEGEDRDAMLERWRAFVRASDVACTWGDYGLTLMETAGGVLPETRIDLRRIARVDTRGRPGPAAEYLARCGGSLDGPARLGVGRAGTRAAIITAVARHLAR
jgi:DTW domain-containing protein YfiP